MEQYLERTIKNTPFSRLINIFSLIVLILISNTASAKHFIDIPDFEAEVAKPYVFVHSGPSASYPKRGILRKGNRVVVTHQVQNGGQTWYRIKWDRGLSAYLPATAVKRVPSWCKTLYPKPPQRVIPHTIRLDANYELRAQPNYKCPPIGTMLKGSSFTVTHKWGQWVWGIDNLTKKQGWILRNRIWM